MRKLPFHIDFLNAQHTTIPLSTIPQGTIPLLSIGRDKIWQIFDRKKRWNALVIARTFLRFCNFTSQIPRARTQNLAASQWEITIISERIAKSHNKQSRRCRSENIELFLETGIQCSSRTFRWMDSQAAMTCLWFSTHFRYGWSAVRIKADLLSSGIHFSGSLLSLKQTRHPTFSHVLERAHLREQTVVIFSGFFWSSERPKMRIRPQITLCVSSCCGL
jgi:hypothetical protein